MKNPLTRCWYCQRYAPAGVCMGPHKNFDRREYRRAVADEHIEIVKHRRGVWP